MAIEGPELPDEGIFIPDPEPGIPVNSEILTEPELPKQNPDLYDPELPDGGIFIPDSELTIEGVQIKGNPEERIILPNGTEAIINPDGTLSFSNLDPNLNPRDHIQDVVTNPDGSVTVVVNEDRPEETMDDLADRAAEEHDQEQRQQRIADILASNISDEVKATMLRNMGINAGKITQMLLSVVPTQDSNPDPDLELSVTDKSRK